MRATLIQLAGIVVVTASLALWSLVIAGVFFGVMVTLLGVALELQGRTDARTIDSETVGTGDDDARGLQQ
jgi:hypothetical protein